jgi:hypothetical protein
MKVVIGILITLGVGWWLFSSNGSNSTNYSYPSSSYNDEETAIDNQDALEDYWDEIMEYIDGSYKVEACSDNSDGCYDLDADINQGVIKTIYFSDGGHIDISGADLDRYGETNGTDESDEWSTWSFRLYDDSIDEALEDWADNKGITLE